MKIKLDSIKIIYPIIVKLYYKVSNNYLTKKCLDLEASIDRYSVKYIGTETNSYKQARLKLWEAIGSLSDSQNQQSYEGALILVQIHVK